MKEWLNQKTYQKKIIEINADVYHLHDPELLTLVSFIKSNNKLVVFDSHEDYISTIGVKEWIPSILRNIIKVCYTKYEKAILKKIGWYHYLLSLDRKTCKEIL